MESRLQNLGLTLPLSLTIHVILDKLLNLSILPLYFFFFFSFCKMTYLLMCDD